MTTDVSVSRIIKAPRKTVFAAFGDANSYIAWLPPHDMKGSVDTFEPRAGGAYRVALTYLDPNHSVPGKTAEHVDVSHGRFLEWIPGERIVQEVAFDSPDPAYAGSMRIIWTFADAEGGTEVMARCEDAPGGIDPDDHRAGFESSLRNLAAFTEKA